MIYIKKQESYINYTKFNVKKKQKIFISKLRMRKYYISEVTDFWIVSFFCVCIFSLLSTHQHRPLVFSLW